MKTLISEIEKQLSEIRSKAVTHEDYSRVYKRELAVMGEFRPAEDDWYPCFHEGLVCIILYDMNPRTNLYLLCVNGADDFSMAKRFSSEEEMMRTYFRIPFIISKQSLIDLEFEYNC